MISDMMVFFFKKVLSRSICYKRWLPRISETLKGVVGKIIPSLALLMFSIQIFISW